MAQDESSPMEAQVALLKARELMAKHKLRQDECIRTDARVVKELVGVSVTTRKYGWAANLSAIIAAHYCCGAYRQHRKYSQQYEIGFIGMEDDFEVCSRIFAYAFDCVKSEADRIFKATAHYEPADYRRNAAEAYGWAFCSGLQAQYDSQDTEHQEWGLVLKTPSEVRKTIEAMGKGKTLGRVKSDWRATKAGYQAGLCFNPSRRIDTVKKAHQLTE